MTVGDRFRAISATDFMADPDGDYVWDGNRIVEMPKQETPPAADDRISTFPGTNGIGITAEG